MMVSDKHKIIWICVPGTGTRSFQDTGNILDFHLISNKISKSTDVEMPLHYPAYMAKQYIEPEKWNTYEKIAFIRNPYTWMNSLFNHKDLKNIGMIKEKLDDPTFENFVMHNTKTPYYWYLDTDETMLIDTLYKTEELNTTIFPRFGVTPIHKNQTSKDKQPNEYSSELKEIMKVRFSREFKHYED